MTQYTTLNPTEIKSIFNDFNIEDIISYEILSGGSENTNYLVESKGGKYVLTICEQKSFQEAQDLAHLLEHLQKHQFKTSKVVRNIHNDPVSRWNGKPLMTKEFIDGNIVRDLSPHLLQLIGKELGRLHRIEAPKSLPTELNYGKEKFSDVKKYAPESSFNDWLEEVLKLLTPYLHHELPRAFIHSDLFWDNVIIGADESSVTIMDFEEASNYYRVFDIGMAIIGLCGEDDKVNLKKARSLLKGYQEEIKLLDIEKDSLKAFTVYAGASMTFWRHMNFNYTKPTPGMEDHYLGLKVLTDFIWEQPEDCFFGLW